MRRITRYFLVGLLVVIVGLLALGALPSYLASGDPYYVTATPVGENGLAVDGTALSERRFPYTTTAIERGRSKPYRKGPFGFKESFSHTPFDEFAEFRQRSPESTTDSVAFVTRNGTRYRVTITRETSQSRRDTVPIAQPPARSWSEILDS